MRILATIVILTAIVLIFVGKGLAGYMPPGFDEGDDGFLQLIKSVANMIVGIGIFLLVVGVLLIVYAMTIG